MIHKLVQNDSTLAETAPTPQNAISSGVRKVLEHHNTGGVRGSPMVQNAVNAVLTAACFGYDDKTHTESAFSGVLGVNSKTVMTWAVDYAYKMHKSGEPIKHGRRVCRYVGIDDLFTAFKSSEAYQEFQFLYPRGSIGKTAIRTSKGRCKCVKQATERSCVDLIMSKVELYHDSLLDAVKYNKVLKETLDKCNCFVHSTAQEHWACLIHSDLKKLLGLTATELVSSVCCAKEEQPDLKLPHHTRAPNVFKWQCANGACRHCGVEKKLLAIQCPVLRSCREEVPANEWLDAERPNNRTQLEVTDTNLKVNTLLSRFTCSIEDARIYLARYQFLNHIRLLDLTCGSSGSLTYALTTVRAPASKPDRLIIHPKTIMAYVKSSQLLIITVT